MDSFDSLFGVCCLCCVFEPVNEGFIYYQLIILSIDKMTELKFNVENILTRNPRLGTVLMIEKFIEEHSGEYKKTALFNSLPKKMMWGTFNVVLEYLVSINKIGADAKGNIIYIWSPEAGKKFMNRRKVQL